MLDCRYHRRDSGARGRRRGAGLIDGDNAKIETIKDGFDGPVSLVQVGDQIYVLDAPLRYLLGPEAQAKKAPPPFKASTVPAPKQ